MRSRLQATEALQNPKPLLLASAPEIEILQPDQPPDALGDGRRAGLPDAVVPGAAGGAPAVRAPGPSCYLIL